MDVGFTAEQREFREEVRTWLAENRPKQTRPMEGLETRDYDLAWQRTQFEAGWAGVSWPKEFGGRGATLIEQLIWYEEYGRADLPSVDSCFVGLNHAGPTLMARASEEQKAFHLPKILAGDVIWCQGFSEPGAGSDLAALSARGEIDGDEIVVTGQKIWTSFANTADWQELLVRTAPGSSRHQGISWVICDMKSPGIEIRPIKTMDGGAEFCEVFYDEVRIPLANVVGEVDRGWDVAMSTLSFERGTAFTAGQVRLAHVVERLVDAARTVVGPDGKRPAIKDDEISRRLALARAEVASMRAMTYANISRTLRTGSPGPEGSIVKLYYSELQQEVARLAMDILGLDGLKFVSRWLPNSWSGYFLFAFSQSIGGGTSEIQRNIIGDRVLGLPR